MIKNSVLILSFLSISNLQAEDMPLLVFPILDSPHITTQCNILINQVLIKASVTKEGNVKFIEFFKKSTIPKLNVEARDNIEKFDFNMVFDQIDESEHKYFKVVIFEYRVPCKST